MSGLALDGSGRAPERRKCCQCIGCAVHVSNFGGALCTGVPSQPNFCSGKYPLAPLVPPRMCLTMPILPVCSRGCFTAESAQSADSIHHASVSSLESHIQHCVTKQTIQCVRPVRAAAKRQRELMAVISCNEMEGVEWIDEGLMILQVFQLPVMNVNNSQYKSLASKNVRITHGLTLRAELEYSRLQAVIWTFLLVFVFMLN
jgi:hypothetical protein